MQPVLRALGLALLFIGFGSLTACGRSSLLGGGGGPTCPEGAKCPVDGGRDFAIAPDGFTSCEQCGSQGCDQPGCCACDVCAGAFFCQQPPDLGPTDGGPVDGGDPCQSKSDCVKLECQGDPACHVPGTEICNNGIDDNDNGLIDCADPECFSYPGCQTKTCPTPPVCTLPACVMDPSCQNLQCHPSVDFGTLQAMMSSSTQTVNTKNTKDVAVTPCAPGGGGMVVAQFTLAGTADVTLAFTQAQGEDHVFGLFAAGVNQECGANPITCYDPKGATSGSTAFQQLPAGHYYLIVQAFEPAGQGSVTVTLSTPTKAEICNNGIDDNGNGLIDCQEASCFNAPNCVNNECKPDINLGAIVVNGPGATTSFTTVGTTPHEDQVQCIGAPGGGDIVVEFTIPQSAGILVNWSQTGDHVMELVKIPAPGQPCDAISLSCYDPSGRSMDSVAFDEQSPGTYAIIWKAVKPGSEGEVNATISLYTSANQELCHNGIDDNNNGLIDCQDPECTGVDGCSAPYCQPDINLGTLQAGDSQTVMLPVAQKGIGGYTASCAKGGGKGMVVQLTIGGTSGVSIGFDCTETGDNIIDLFQAGGPRDPCDTNELVCADPNTLPFGCGYAVPNLNPGTYNVLVEGFKSGSEGSMQLTLSVMNDRVQEICNNGIDDNNNGLIDCADPDCATYPACIKAACHPDATINPMPLDGSTTFRLVQTANNGSQANIPCAKTPGGQTAVIEITLTANANLNLEWSQIGNHDFALYTESGTTTACNAGTMLGCDPSMGVKDSTVSFTNVPEGKVYLVVAADAPDASGMQESGSVSVALSGMPTN